MSAQDGRLPVQVHLPLWAIHWAWAWTLCEYDKVIGKHLNGPTEKNIIRRFWDKHSGICGEAAALILFHFPAAFWVRDPLGYGCPDVNFFQVRTGLLPWYNLNIKTGKKGDKPNIPYLLVTRVNQRTYNIIGALMGGLQKALELREKGIGWEPEYSGVEYPGTENWLIPQEVLEKDILSDYRGKGYENVPFVDFDERCFSGYQYPVPNLSSLVPPGEYPWSKPCRAIIQDALVKGGEIQEMLYDLNPRIYPPGYARELEAMLAVRRSLRVGVQEQTARP
jgi:hypothetical protein